MNINIHTHFQIHEYIIFFKIVVIPKRYTSIDQYQNI